MNSRFFISLLLFVCLLLVSWIFQQWYIKPAKTAITFFENTQALAVLFSDEPNMSDRNEIKVVYFWQDNCPCDQAVKPHFLLMLESYRKKSGYEAGKVRIPVQFFLAVLNKPYFFSKTVEFDGVSILSNMLLNKVKHEVVATPSVGIWDQDNKLVYFGPHNMGYVCNDETSLIKKVLDALLAGRPIAMTSVMGDGCFCSAKS